MNSKVLLTHSCKFERIHETWQLSQFMSVTAAVLCKWIKKRIHELCKCIVGGGIA